MRLDGMFIAGTGRCLPKAVTTADAVASGAYDQDNVVVGRQLAVTVADDDTRAVDLAVTAARQALDRSGHDRSDIGVMPYAVSFDGGVFGWHPSGYIQRELGTECFAPEVRHGCAGGLAAVEFACTYLLAQSDLPAAVALAAECWRPESTDRWRNGSGMLLADGAGALVVSRERGFARILSLVNHSDSTLEGIYRGDERFGIARGSYPVDFALRAKQFFAGSMTIPEFQHRVEAGLRQVVAKALDEAGVSVDDIDHFVCPFAPHHMLQGGFLTPLGIGIEKTLWEFERQVGHLGAADQLVGYDELAASGRLAPGDRALLLGVGSGCVWNAAVIQTLHTPRYQVDDGI